MTLFEFEKKYKNILNGIEEWNYLRIPIGFYLKNKNNLKVNKSQRKKNILKKLILIKLSLKNIFFFSKNWFRKYDYICFSSSNERILLNGKYFYRLGDRFIEKLDGKTLLIEKPTPIHYQNNYTKYIVSDSLITSLSSLFARFSFIKINTNYELKKLLLEMNINIEIEKIIRIFNLQYKLYKILFNIYKPKFIFLSCYYCRISLVKAANDLEIPIIEFQHGVINREHYAYCTPLELNKVFLPTCLLSFGLNELKLPIQIPKVFPIGNYYLEYINSNFSPSLELKQIIKKYRFTIGISMQDQEWERKALFDFIREVSTQRKDILFILIPRRKKDFPNFNDNVIVWKNTDCYSTIKHCNFHMTLYSSCALEAPSLGIANILLNKRNFAKKYYSDVLDSFHTQIINNKVEFFDSIEKMSNLENIFIMNKNKNIFIDNYDRNVEDFLKYLKVNFRKKFNKKT